MNYRTDIWPIDKFIPYEKNPRKNDDVVDTMVEGIRVYGFRMPILALSTGLVIDGHLRLKAAKKIGMTELPVHIVDDLDEAHIKALRIWANKSANLAAWDTDLLKLELEDLKIENFNLDLTGFTNIEIQDMFKVDAPGDVAGEEDEQEESEFQGEKSEPISKLGDIWCCGEHRILCGDSTIPSDVNLLLDGKEPRLLFADPPYNVDYAEKNKKMNKKDGGNWCTDDIENDTYTTDLQCAEKLWKPVFENILDYVSEDCSFYCTMPQGPAHAMLIQVIHHSGWQPKYELIWQKNKFVLGRGDYNYRHEPILFGWYKKHVFYGKGKYLDSVWYIDKPVKNDVHPTMKPVQLVRNCILNSSTGGDIVIDPFLGSGTTLIACAQTGRICYGIELVPRYVDVAVERWQRLTGKQASLLASGVLYDDCKNAK